MSKYVANIGNQKPPEDDWSSSDEEDDNRLKQPQRIIDRGVQEKMGGISLSNMSQQVGVNHDKRRNVRTVEVDQKLSHTVMEVEKTAAHPSTMVNRTGDAGVNWDGGAVNSGVGLHDSQKPAKPSKVDIKNIRSKFSNKNVMNNNIGKVKPQIQKNFNKIKRNKVCNRYL